VRCALLSAVLPLVLPFAGCVGDDTNSALPPSDAGSPADATLTGADASDGAVPLAPVAGLRLAHWAADAPAIDFCVAPHGSSSFGAPLLAAAWVALADAGVEGEAGSAALSFSQASAYVVLPAGAYDARVVAAGSVDCSTGIGGDLATLPPLGTGAFATVALIGDPHPKVGTVGAPALRLVGLLDDLKAPGAIGLRFVNASPLLPQADLGTGTLLGTFKPLASGVAFGDPPPPSEAGAPDGSIVVDPQGYAAIGALSAVTLSAHATGGTSDTVVVSNVSAAKGSVLTVALVGGSLGDDGAVVGALLVQCEDNAGTVGVFGSCAALSP
jgi:hypothetical protein